MVFDYDIIIPYICNMKQYDLLRIPEDSAWERKSIRKYIPIWLLEITDGIYNIFRWMPTIYKNKDWDSYYIYEVLKKKIEFQRKYLIEHNRHLSIPSSNYWMTVSLNLIERLQEDFYSMEYFDYHESRLDFFPSNREGLSRIESTLLNERFDDYLNKYPLIVKKFIDSSTKDGIVDKQYLCLLVGGENQKRSKKLLFKILEDKLEGWWD